MPRLDANELTHHPQIVLQADEWYERTGDQRIDAEGPHGPITSSARSCASSTAFFHGISRGKRPPAFFNALQRTFRRDERQPVTLTGCQHRARIKALPDGRPLAKAACTPSSAAKPMMVDGQTNPDGRDRQTAGRPDDRQMSDAIRSQPPCHSTAGLGIVPRRSCATSSARKAWSMRP